MTGRPLLGVLLALFVESAHWIRVRWDFNDEACARAWQLSVVAILLSGMLIYLDGPATMTASTLLTWLPPLLLPMQFIQSFGLRNAVPANTFSLLAQQRRKRNVRLGLTESVVLINFGNVTFVTALVGSTLGTSSNGAYSWLFLPGIIVLTGWMLLSSSRSRPASLIVALVVAGLIALAGQKALEEVYDRLGNSEATRSGFDPKWVNTLIGKRGTIEQSSDIIWRLKPAEKQAPPALLRTATYNTYHWNGSWLCQPFPELEFNDLDTRLQENVPYYLLSVAAPEAEQIRAVGKEQRRYTMRGSVVAESPLALPGNTSSVTGFELDGIERNNFGTVRVYPKHSVIEGSVLWSGGFSGENPVSLREDLNVPAIERATLQAVLKELDLLEPASPESARPRRTLREKISILQNWFRRDFQYSRNLTIRASANDPAHPTAIEQFLTKTKSGHCEYFAAATTLLLRQAGVPARYAIGYAVAERDVPRKEFIIRGTHGHAWCRAWDEKEKTWIDIDTTPPGWVGTLPQRNTTKQRFNDMLKRWREDFFLWRNQPSNKLAVSLVMGAIASGVLVFIMKRLWKSKRRMDAERRMNGYGGPAIRTPLHSIEKTARKRIGPRPPGMPFSEWLLRLRPGLADGHLLDEAISLHQRLRYDPAPAMPDERERLTELVKQLEKVV
ncbi:transglutaminase domain-containing protein [Luteolibacter yonseiensis]|uniref:Transglutaminase domain-containing protein n=1 Tax=Luteolibacter yonseiensis TaxID=1144680 RepID=A0A934VDD7_9BACT|nr:transglutaminase-like domain-containing protein [Luteolibacter yonseiensis]MBK1817911.1 transglutaminase domain-containing protein [Luteolibacter yonseiensis]